MPAIQLQAGSRGEQVNLERIFVGSGDVISNLAEKVEVVIEVLDRRLGYEEIRFWSDVFKNGGRVNSFKFDRDP